MGAPFVSPWRRATSFSSSALDSSFGAGGVGGGLGMISALPVPTAARAPEADLTGAERAVGCGGGGCLVYEGNVRVAAGCTDGGEATGTSTQNSHARHLQYWQSSARVLNRQNTGVHFSRSSSSAKRFAQRGAAGGSGEGEGGFGEGEGGGGGGGGCGEGEGGGGGGGGLGGGLQNLHARHLQFGQ